MNTFMTIGSPSGTRGKRSIRTLAIASLLATVPATLIALPAQAGTTQSPTATSAPSTRTTCPQYFWGSLEKSANPMSGNHVSDIRTGRNACYDRLVIDLPGSSAGTIGYDVRYVDNVYADATGDLVPLAGGAKLQIVVHAPAYDINTGASTYTPADRTQLTDVAGYRTFRQVAWANSFEGQTTIGLGVRATLPMRVFVLSGPGNSLRLVVDVAHRWGAW